MPSPDSPSPRIRVAVADDHPIFWEGLVRLLQSRPDLEIVGAANDGDEALTLVKALGPDLLLLDMAMPRMSGLIALREMQGMKIRTQIVLLTAAIEPPDIVTALQLGARAVVLKESASDVLYQCIRAVMDGQYWLGRKPVQTLVAAMREASESYSPSDKHYGLTEREREIVGVILDGCSNAAIAGKFAISEKTVKQHLTNIFDKVGVSNRLELALFALHHKLDTGPPQQPAMSARPTEPSREL